MSGLSHLKSNYVCESARIMPGDVIAFSGEGLVSNTIARFTDSPISHVGVVFGRSSDGGILLAESTTLNATGVKGVSLFNDLETRIEGYEGGVYWLPLDDMIARRFRFSQFQEFLLATTGTRYDYRQVLQFAVRRYLPRLARRLPWYGEDLGRLFCSELVTLALERGGVLPDGLNASAVSPAELVAFGIYGPHYIQLKGMPRGIPNFNSVPLGALYAKAAA